LSREEEEEEEEALDQNKNMNDDREPFLNLKDLRPMTLDNLMMSSSQPSLGGKYGGISSQM